MDLVTTVIFCNCTIALSIFIATLWTVQFRKQIGALADWFDRCNGEVDRATPLATSIAERRSQLRYLRQLYRQQLLTLDRLQSLIAVAGVARSLYRRRR
ncbi:MULTISPECIES: hypothetical protein [unclassified Chamaesiphon]|uniref:hypothetical protein n=1 Tax=unclassified Chamaesiphon TaxID=2620921 RepID=UPI00286B51E7|nr:MULTISPECIES: hypothetical protein [unclassified Chamaesiphon]